MCKCAFFTSSYRIWNNYLASCIYQLTVSRWSVVEWTQCDAQHQVRSWRWNLLSCPSSSGSGRYVTQHMPGPQSLQLSCPETLAVSWGMESAFSIHRRGVRWRYGYGFEPSYISFQLWCEGSAEEWTNMLRGWVKGYKFIALGCQGTCNEENVLANCTICNMYKITNDSLEGTSSTKP